MQWALEQLAKPQPDHDAATQPAAAVDCVEFVETGEQNTARPRRSAELPLRLSVRAVALAAAAVCVCSMQLTPGTGFIFYFVGKTSSRTSTPRYPHSTYHESDN